MLRAMRGAAETWIIKVLMVVLVISFSIWGVGDMFKGNPQQRLVSCIGGVYIPLKILFGSNAAICTGQQVTVGMLEREFTRIFELAKNKTPDLTAAEAKKKGFLDQALRAISGRFLFDHVAKDFELRYDNKAVLAQLANMPELRAKDGSFDQEAFQRVTRNMQMTEAEFINFMRDDFARNQSIGIFSALATPPQTLFDQILRAQGQEILTEIITLPHEMLPAPPAPDAATLEKYYQDNPKLFTVPEYRTFSVLRITLDDLANGFSVSDEQVAAAFEKHKDEFARGEQRTLRQVVLSNEDEANALAKAARAKHSLQQAAEAIKKDVVTLEDRSESNIPPALYTTVFAADQGSINDPVKSDFGYHVIEVTKITPAYTPKLDEVKDKLRQKLQREKAQEAIQELANKIDDALDDGKSLEELAADFQLKLEKHEQLNRDGFDKDGKKPEIQNYGIILQNAFGLNEGEGSPVLDDHRGNFIVVRTDKIFVSQPPPYAEIKDKVLKNWVAAEQRKAAAAQADKIRAEWLKQPKIFKELSQRPPLSGKTGAPLSLLGGLSPDMPHAMQPEVLSLKLGEIAIGSEANKHYIVRLSGFGAYDAAKNTEAQSGVKNQLEKGWRADVLDMFEAALRIQQPVRFNPTLLETLRKADEDKPE